MRWLPSPLANVWLRRVTRRRIERRLMELRQTTTASSPIELSFHDWWYGHREN